MSSISKLTLLCAALVLSFAARPAAAVTVALLPPLPEAAAVDALSAQLTAAGHEVITLAPEELLDRAKLDPANVPVAVLLGGERFADTITEDGDASTALLNYVERGGSLLVAADGPTLGRPQRWTGEEWTTVNAATRRFILATHLGLLDAGQPLDAAPPADSNFVVADQLTGAGLPAQVALPAGGATWRPIPGTQDASLSFVPLLTLVDAAGATYGAGVAEMSRLDRPESGRVVYVWAPLLAGQPGVELLRASIGGRVVAGDDRPAALAARRDRVRGVLAGARAILPANLASPTLDAVRADLTRYEGDLRAAEAALAADDLNTAEQRLDVLEPATEGLAVRAGRAVDEAAALSLASIPAAPAPATPEPVEPVTPEPVEPVTPEPVEPVTPEPVEPVTPEPATPEPVTPEPATPAPTTPAADVENPVIAFTFGDRGTVTMELYPKIAPRTVSSILYLARAGFYERTYIHRRQERFVIQGGDPFTRTLPPDDPKVGTGGPDWTVPAEFSRVVSHERGAVGLARDPADPDSGGSQFYICLEPQPTLDGSYTVFGKVIGGLDVVDTIQIGDRITEVKIVSGAAEKNPAGVAPLDLYTP